MGGRTDTILSDDYDFEGRDEIFRSGTPPAFMAKQIARTIKEALSNLDIWSRLTKARLLCNLVIIIRNEAIAIFEW